MSQLLCAGWGGGGETASDVHGVVRLAGIISLLPLRSPFVPRLKFVKFSVAAARDTREFCEILTRTRPSAARSPIDYSVVFFSFLLLSTFIFVRR